MIISWCFRKGLPYINLPESRTVWLWWCPAVPSPLLRWRDSSSSLGVDWWKTTVCILWTSILYKKLSMLSRRHLRVSGDDDVATTYASMDCLSIVTYRHYFTFLWCIITFVINHTAYELTPPQHKYHHTVVKGRWRAVSYIMSLCCYCNTVRYSNWLHGSDLMSLFQLCRKW